jgi:hypothetical protein
MLDREVLIIISLFIYIINNIIIIDLFGTKEELEDTEDFFPFIYCPINVH